MQNIINTLYLSQYTSFVNLTFGFFSFFSFSLSLYYTKKCAESLWWCVNHCLKKEEIVTENEVEGRNIIWIVSLKALSDIAFLKQRRKGAFQRPKMAKKIPKQFFPNHLVSNKANQTSKTSPLIALLFCYIVFYHSFSLITSIYQWAPPFFPLIKLLFYMWFIWISFLFLLWDDVKEIIEKFYSWFCQFFFFTLTF